MEVYQNQILKLHLSSGRVRRKRIRPLTVIGVFSGLVVVGILGGLCLSYHLMAWRATPKRKKTVLEFVTVRVCLLVIQRKRFR